MPIPNKLSLRRRRRIAKLYVLGKSTAQIATMFSVGRGTVRYHLRQQGITSRPSGAPTRCSINHDAFDVLTPEACYWAGLLFTDGAFHRTRQRIPVITLSLTQRDKQQVYNLAKFLQSTYKIGRRAARDNGMIKSKPSFSHAFLSQKIYDRFYELGYARLESCPIDELRKSRDFWRGVVDGDGCISLRSNGTLTVGKGRKLVEAFREFISSVYPEARRGFHSQGSIVCTGISGRGARKLLSELYYPGCIAIERKRRRATEIISQYDQSLGE